MTQNIVSYFGTVVNGDTELWILMENCEVGSVRDIMKANFGPLEEEQISVVTYNVVIGLVYLHSQSIIHFDVKAANILVTMKLEIKLADFGVSQKIETEVNRAQDLIGSPLWMSPEVIQKRDFTNTTDVWSLGITVIEMADAAAPYAGKPVMEVIKWIPVRDPPTVRDPSSFSDELNQFVKDCLIKDGEERPSSKDLMVHEFVQTSKGSEVLQELVVTTVETKRRQAAKKAGGDAPSAAESTF